MGTLGLADPSAVVARLALRHTFCGVAADDTRRMVGGNAEDIEAPTLEEVATPIDAVPDGASLTAFRSGSGGWA